jgi:hypothetical protein
MVIPGVRRPTAIFARGEIVSVIEGGSLAKPQQMVNRDVGKTDNPAIEIASRDAEPAPAKTV